MHRSLCSAACLFLASASAVVGQPCQPTWSSPFDGGDTNATMRAVTVFDDGHGTGQELYAAGAFTKAGGVRAYGVAKWNGAAWSPVGGDFDGEVNALTVHSDATGTFLYAGGVFRHVGGIPATFIARWNGTSWVGVGSGTALSGGGVWSLLSNPSDTFYPGLWAGGRYLSLSGQPTSQSPIVRWNGTSWVLLPSSFQTNFQPVYSMSLYPETSGFSVYVAGVVGYPYNNIAKFDRGSWSAIGPTNSAGTNGTVYALCLHNDGAGVGLFAGGEFTTAGGVAAQHIARWNGSTWAPVGQGADGPVLSLASVDLDGPFGQPARLVAGGEFSTIGGAPAKFLGQWDGNSWTGFGGLTPNDAVRALAARTASPQALYVAGSFSGIGPLPASRAAAYSPSAGWTALANPNTGNAPSEQVRALAAFDDDGPGPHAPKLYVGGDFHSVGSMQVEHIAAWSGSSWSPLGQGLNGGVRALHVLSDTSPIGRGIVAGGSFSTAGGVAAANIARWDGSVWSALGAGLPGAVYAVAEYGSPPALYAGGSFPPAGPGAYSGTARFDGSNWTQLGPNGVVYCFAIFDDGSGAGPRLYAGGQSLQTATGMDCVVRWNGSAWEPAGMPSQLAFSNAITSMAVFDDGTGPALYAAGLLQTTTFNSQAARLRASGWEYLGVENGGLNYPMTLAVCDDGTGPALYAGGPFTSIAGVAANRVVRWNGSLWSPVGSGITGLAANTSVNAIEAFDEDGPGPGASSIYFGGSFGSAGGVPAPRLARLESCVCYANCDGSTTAPVLNVSDFICFLNRYSAGDSYANCDGSTAPPVLNVSDFVCFLNRYGAGCP